MGRALRVSVARELPRTDDEERPTRSEGCLVHVDRSIREEHSLCRRCGGEPCQCSEAEVESGGPGE